ncbi:MAG: hypothetical protein ABFS35_00775, partial [Bacteroidota bacterium]
MKKPGLMILSVLLSLSIAAQSIDEKNRLVYSINELETGNFLQDFMMIGPFPNPLPDGVKNYFHLDHTCLGFSKDYLINAGGEKEVHPFIGQTVEYEPGKSLKWEKEHSSNNEVDLKRIFTPNEKVVCYAAIWIESDKEQEKIFGIGSNDGIKAWFNGKMILKVHKPRTVNIDDEYLKLNFKKGLNLLLLKIEQGFGGWGFVLRPVDNKT